MEIQRFVPDSELLGMYEYFISENQNSTVIIEPNSYLLAVQNYEEQIENYLIEVLNNLGILASVKTIRYSLPYHKEIVNTQRRNGLNYRAFDLQEFVRQVVKVLLELKVKKLRFYVIGDFIIEKNDSFFKYSHVIVAKFRYMIHDQFKV